MHKQLSCPSTLFKDLIEQIVGKIEDEFDEDLIIQNMGHLPKRGEKIVLEQLQFNVTTPTIADYIL